MIQQTFFTLESFLDFLRYIKKGTSFTYVEGSSNYFTVELKQEDYDEARREYEADSNTD